MKRSGSNPLGHARKGTAVPSWPAWAWGILAIGILLRAAQYSCGRSLWNDEAELALNILQRPFAGLFQPLQFHQGAPIGFMLLEKLITLASKSEIALRAIPFAAGIVALFLFYDVARLYLSAEAVPLALGLFSLNRVVVYYSSEVKQYSTDVLVTLILLRAVYKLSQTRNPRDLFGIGVLGSLAIWFSHPASFVLAGAAAILVAANLLQHNRESLGRMIWVFAAWAASFGICYFVSLRSLSHDEMLLEYWRGNFAPHGLVLMIPWAAHNFFAVFENPASLNSILGAAFFVAGCGELLRRNWLRFGLLTAPLPVLFLASLLHLYPLYGRLLLFLCPILLLVVSEGAVWVYRAAGRVSPILGIALIAWLLAKPTYLAADTLLHPLRPDDIKAGIRYIESHQRPGDRWYVYYGAKYQIAYYAVAYNLPMANVRIGADCGRDGSCYGTDITQFRGSPRIWILLSHILPYDSGDEGTLLRDQLDLIGTRLETFETSGVRVYLYDLDRPVPIQPSDH